MNGTDTSVPSQVKATTAISSGARRAISNTPIPCPRCTASARIDRASAGRKWWKAVKIVRKQVREKHWHPDSSREPAPRAPSARAEVNNPARFRAFERAAQQRTHRIVGTGEILAKRQEVSQRVAQRRRTGR